MPGNSQPAAKLQAETPLTPARSFRDENLTRTDLGLYRLQVFLYATVCPGFLGVLAPCLLGGRMLAGGPPVLQERISQNALPGAPKARLGRQRALLASEECLSLRAQQAGEELLDRLPLLGDRDP
jgi:hypothetical protein